MPICGGYQRFLGRLGGIKTTVCYLHKWEKHIGTGHWPDADMIPFGVLNRRGPDDGIERESNFTDAGKIYLDDLVEHYTFALNVWWRFNDDSTNGIKTIDQ